MSRSYASRTTRRRDDISLRLQAHGIEEALMPERQLVVSFSTKVRTIGLLIGALLIIGLYIGVPLSAASHSVLKAASQNMVLSFAILIEVAALMLIIILKTDSRR